MTPERWGPKRWLKQCVALDSETGHRCTLLEHGREVDHSASGRLFKNPLAAGASPRRELDLYAGNRNENPMGVQ